MGQPESRSTRRKTRRDGWTAERQLGFLAALARTRSVTKATAAVGMSRESAHRLRGRPNAALFAAAWDRAMEGHKLVNFTSRRRTTDGPIFGGIPPKFRTR
jgi:hypothetical protein